MLYELWYALAVAVAVEVVVVVDDDNKENTEDGNLILADGMGALAFQ